MRRLLLLAVVLACAWFGWRRLAPARTPGGGTDEVTAPAGPDRAKEPRGLGDGARPPAAPRAAHPCAERNQRAIAALEAGRLAEAVALFEECHAEDPEHPVFRANLVEALVRWARALHEEEFDLGGAVAALERALEVSAGAREDEDALRSALERWRRELALEQHHETRGSDLFELSYDTRNDQLLHRSQEVLNHLESVYEDLREWFQTDPVRDGGRAPIKVVLYDRAGFDAVTGLGDWAGGVFDGVVRLPLEDLAGERSRWQAVLRHELVHAFAHAVAGGPVPGWLNEGLAQWLDGEADVAAAQALLRAALREGGRPYELDRLDGSLATWKDPAEISLAYAQSLVLVDHIARNYGEDVLRAMVAGRAQGRDAATSFERETGVPLSFVLVDFTRYL